MLCHAVMCVDAGSTRTHVSIISVYVVFACLLPNNNKNAALSCAQLALSKCRAGYCDSMPADRNGAHTLYRTGKP